MPAPVPTPADLRALPVFSRAPWQMSYGERAALEGVLATLKPSLALEIGRAEGGSLRRIAAHAQRVISFDLVAAEPEVAALTNVTIKVGNSHRQLPDQLAELAREGQNVDFVLIDGDHSADGARADMMDLLQSDAVNRCVILAHDSLNEEVRAGLEAVDYERYPKVAFVDLDFVPGIVARVDAYFGHCWGGLGLVVVDSSDEFRDGELRNPTAFPHPEVMWPWAADRRARPATSASPNPYGDSANPDTSRAGDHERELIRLREENQHLRADLACHQGWLASIQGSASWKLTAPLRRAKRRWVR